MATPRMQRLNQMADAFPMQNDAAEGRQQAALDIQMQNTIGGAPSGTSGKAASQALATQAATVAGQAAVAGQQQSQANQMAIGEAVVGEQQRVGQANLAAASQSQQAALGQQSASSQLAIQNADVANRKEITGEEIAQAERMQQMGLEQDNRLQALTLEQRETLAQLGGNLKQELFDNQMVFSKDELGRKFSNERQLADYAKASAETNIEFQTQMREMQQIAQKEMIMLEAAQNKINQALSQEYAKGKQKLDQAAREQLVMAQKNMNDTIAKKKKNAAIISAVLIGGGAIVGGPAGAGVGMAAAGAYNASE